MFAMQCFMEEVTFFTDKCFFPTTAYLVCGLGACHKYTSRIGEMWQKLHDLLHGMISSLEKRE